MPNLSLRIRLIVFLALAGALGGLYYLGGKVQEVPEQYAAVPFAPLPAPADGTIAVSVDGFGFTPFGKLSMRVGGLDAEAATAVVFTIRNGERLTVPVPKHVNDVIEVPVPPIAYDPAKGEFGPHQASVMVVQTKRVGDKLTVRSSNKSGDFFIYAPPSVSACAESAGGQVPKGSFAKLAMAVAVERLRSVAGKVTADQPELAAAVAKARTEMEKLLTGVETIMKDPQAKVELWPGDGSAENLSEADLAWLDAHYAAFLGKLGQPETPTPTSFLPLSVPAAVAAPSSACIENVQKYFSGTPAMSGYVVKLCNLTDPDSPLLPKKGSGEWLNEYYLLQLDLSQLVGGATEKWSVGGKVSAAAAFSMLCDLAIEGKLPDMGAFANIGISLGGELGDKLLAKYGAKAVFGDILWAVEVWDQLCKALPQTKCLKSDEIVLGVRDILIDMTERTVDGLLVPLVDAAMIPDYSKAIDLEPIGLDNGGYDDAAGIKPPPEPAPAPKPSPKPIVPDDITPVPTPPTPKPPPAPTPRCNADACAKGCGSVEAIMEAYRQCLAECEKLDNLFKRSDCSNVCIGEQRKSEFARSDCSVACYEAYNNGLPCP